MNILYITHNSSLRSTTCVLDATISQLLPIGLRASFVFASEGPWSEALIEQKINVYYHEFLVPDKKVPIRFLLNFFFWVRIIRKEKIELIHVNEHENYPMIKHAAKFLRIPVVVGVRYVLPSGYSEWAFSGRYKPVKLLFTSHDQLERSRNALPSNIRESDIEILGNGRDLDKLISSPTMRSETREIWNVPVSCMVLGTASVIRPRKKLEDFIEMVKSLLEKKHDVKGVIAGGGKFGDPNYFKSLEELIKKYNLQNKVLMLGNLDDIAPFYHSIDLFVSTSELETFGMSVCEAMAFSLPVIGYEGGSVKEVLDDPRCVVKNFDLNGLVHLAEKILANSEYRETLGTKNKKRAFDYFNAPSLAKKLKLIYESILNRKG